MIGGTVFNNSTVDLSKLEASALEFVHKHISELGLI